MMIIKTKVNVIFLLLLMCQLPSVSYSTIFTMATNHEWESVLLRVNQGIDVNQSDKQGRTLLMYAATLNLPKVLNRLIKAGSALNQQDENGDTALDHAVRSGQYEQTYLLIKAGANHLKQDQIEKNLISQSLKWNDTNTALTLLELGVVPLPQDFDKLSLLLIEAIDRSLINVTLNLLKFDLDFNTHDKSSKTALMIAAQKGYITIVEKLIQAGASVHEEDLKGRTALGVAIHALTISGNGKIEMGYQDPLQNLFNEIPIVNYKAVIKALRHAGAKANDTIINDLLDQEGEKQGFWNYYIRSQLYYWEIILFYLGVVLTMILLFRQFEIWVDIIAVCISVLITCIATIGLAGNHLPEVQYGLTTTIVGHVLFATLRALVISAFAVSLIYLIYQLLETTTDSYECVIIEDDLSCENCGKSITLDNRNKGFCPFCKKRFKSESEK